MSSQYPDEVQARSISSEYARRNPESNIEGRFAALECGTYVSFLLEIDADRKSVRSAAFRSNGCGWMIAAADVLAERLNGRRFADLHGLEFSELARNVVDTLCEFPAARRHCLTTCIEAIKQAFGEFRRRQLEEFAGEKALICTCFGVSEDTIEKAIVSRRPMTVADVGALTRAGTGCGSCQFLIQELIDAAGGA